MMSSPSILPNTPESALFVQSRISTRKSLPLYFALFCCLTLSPSGNWGVDLQGGSEDGYKLLFIVFLAGAFTVFLQVRLISWQSESGPHDTDRLSRVNWDASPEQVNAQAINIRPPRTPLTIGFSSRSRLALSSVVLQSPQTHIGIPLDRPLPSLCPLRDRHRKHRSRGAPRLRHGSRHAISEAPVVDGCPCHHLRCFRHPIGW